MHLNSFRDQIGYWGLPTSSIDWCEPNYVTSHYVAEFWNSMSSFMISLGGIVGMYWVYRCNMGSQLMFYCLMLTVVGIGSALYHGTLLFELQMLDELPMVYCLTSLWYTWFHVRREIATKVNPKRYGPHEAGCRWFETVYFLRPFASVGMWLQSIPLLGTVLRNRALAMFLYNVLLSVAHVVGKFTLLFQVHFGVMLFFGFLCAWDFTKHYHHSPRALRLFNIHLGLYLGFALAAFALWLLDNFMCSQLLALPVYPQFHAWWHVLCGGSTYCTLVLNAMALNMLQTSKMVNVEVDKDGKEITGPNEAAPVLVKGKQDVNGLTLRKNPVVGGKHGEDVEYDIERAEFVCQTPVVDMVKIGGIPTVYHYVHNIDGTKL